MYKNHRKIMIIINVIVLIVLLVKAPGANLSEIEKSKMDDIIRDDGRTTYIIPPHLCYTILGIDAEVFFDKPRGVDQGYEDLRDHAHFDDEGNLVLNLTEKQKEFFLELGFGGIEKARSVGIEVSDDYRTFTIECYGDEIDNIMENYPFFLVFDMKMHQFLYSYDPDSFYIACKVIDAANGNIVYEASLVDGEEIIFSEETIGKDKFSPRP